MIVRYICMYVYIYIYIILFDPHLWLNEAGHHIIWSVVQLIQRFTSERLWKIAGEPKTVHSSIVTAFRTRLIKKNSSSKFPRNNVPVFFFYFRTWHLLSPVEGVVLKHGVPLECNGSRLLFLFFPHFSTAWPDIQEKKKYI